MSYLRFCATAQALGVAGSPDISSFTPKLLGVARLKPAGIKGFYWAFSPQPS